jgi:hypothetical protein
MAVTTRKATRGTAAEAVKAHNAAVRRLKEAHADELTAYVREERVARGLPPTPFVGLKPGQLRAQIERWQKRIAEWEAKLERGER